MQPAHIMRLRSMQFFLGAYLAMTALVQATIDCTDVLSSADPFTGICNNKWKHIKPHLRPTQPQVGYAWIQHKLESGYTSSSAAQSSMDETTVPAVLGPGPAIYLVDDHHTSCALDYSGYDDTSVTYDVLCDLRNLPVDEFWATLDAQNLAYLASHPANDSNALPQKISSKQLPSAFSFTERVKTLTDDPWRSVAGFSRKVRMPPSPAPSCGGSDSEYCERCMYRGCGDGYQKAGPGVAYFEFRWAYMMNDATYFNPSLWSSEEQRVRFVKAFEAIQNASFGKIDTNAWLEAAGDVVSLCRAESIAKYALDPSLFPGAGTTSLPGYISGYSKIADDPSCSSPVCKMPAGAAGVVMKPADARRLAP